MAKAKSENKNQKTEKFRTPIVAVMGHVDHGKTSLLDTIRGTRVQAKEEGGITQNTRAHQIVTENGNKITFIDTPGHEAFSAMRSRGAEVTDFVALVVAADDGIQAQTKQSIEFAKATNTPIIVVINKIDIQGVKTQKIKQELASFGVNIEEYGGDSLCFEVSATKNIGIKEFIEGIELLSEVNDLKPNPVEHGAKAMAYVLESTNDKRLGPVALCILKAGELDEKVFGATKSGTFKVRAYLDQDQKPTDTVYESDPFWVTGLPDAVKTGEFIYFTEDDKKAKQIQSELANLEAEHEKQEAEKAEMDAQSLLMQMLIKKEAEKQGLDQKVLNVIVRASTQGTLEAVLNELNKLGDDEKTIRVLESGTGEVSESDIRRAKTAGGIVVSFQLPTNSKIAGLAKQNKVLVRNYDIIYEMVDELTGALEGLIEPTEVEVEVARARVKQIFVLSDGEIVAGCEVIKGTLIKGYQVFVERPSESTKDQIAEIGRGKISSLKILKDEAKEAKKGQECGIILSPRVTEIQAGDEIVAFKLERS